MNGHAAHKSESLAKTARIQYRGVNISAGDSIANTKQAEPVVILPGQSVPFS